MRFKPTQKAPTMSMTKAIEDFDMSPPVLGKPPPAFDTEAGATVVVDVP